MHLNKFLLLRMPIKISIPSNKKPINLLGNCQISRIKVEQQFKNQQEIDTHEQSRWQIWIFSPRRIE